jgi:hypothetical protein
MTYQATWTNGSQAGRVQSGVDRIRVCDAAQLAAAINRRRLLTFQAQQDFSSFIGAGFWLRRTLLDGAAAPPFDDFRGNVCHQILEPPAGMVPGLPPSPTAMQWLWPRGDGDENKVIVETNPGPGQVGLFDRLNGTSGWTDPGLSGGCTPIRGVHWNELRQSIEWLSRGRWILPVYFSGGLFSLLPDTPWFGGAIGNNGSSELRTIGFSILRYPGQPTAGLANVTVRASSYLEITSDVSCGAQVSHCLRPIDFVNDFPSWNKYQPRAGLAWGTPGGVGGGDSTSLGAMSLSQGAPAQFSGGGLASALQAMVDGAEMNLLLQRTDNGPQTVSVTGRLVVEFDLSSPPN